jgi:hypothetical protein
VNNEEGATIIQRKWPNLLNKESTQTSQHKQTRFLPLNHFLPLPPPLDTTLSPTLSHSQKSSSSIGKKLPKAY